MCYDYLSTYTHACYKAHITKQSSIDKYAHTHMHICIKTHTHMYIYIYTYYIVYMYTYRMCKGRRIFFRKALKSRTFQRVV